MVHPAYPAAIAAVLAAGCWTGPLAAQKSHPLVDSLRRYVAVDHPTVVIRGVQVVDGTGRPPAQRRTVVIEGDRILHVGPDGAVPVPAGATVLDRPGATVIPGIVGVHNHTFYVTVAGRRVQLNSSSPRLYLGAGVTTIRTAGSIAPYAEIWLKHRIEAGEAIGPRMEVTGPYLNGPNEAPYHPAIATPEHARRVVDYWADEGATWFKVYTDISRANLAAIIQAAHARGLKVAGHLCSVGFREAAELGIDVLEHGLLDNREYDPAKEPDRCPPRNLPLIAGLEIGSDKVRSTFRALIDRGIPMTSTLAIYEASLPERPPLESRVLDAMSPETRGEYLATRLRFARLADSVVRRRAFRKAMDYEIAFVRAGGLLAAGVDPTGTGGALPGYGDQRNYELLIEAGFVPVEAIRIMTANGAKLLGKLDELGTVEPGKLADLVLIDGDPIRDPAAIRRVAVVFKNGIGYDAPALLESARGLVGIR